MRRILKKEEDACRLHNDFFALHQDFCEVENEQKYWDSLVKAMGEMSRKYRDINKSMGVFVDHLLVAFAEWQNRKVTKQTMNDRELLADFILRSHSKEDVESIIKALQKGVSE